MAAVAVQAASPAHHYIRTIHTSFTAAHSNPWARSSAHVAASSPLLSSNHANMPLYASQPLGSSTSTHVQGSSGPLKYAQPSGGNSLSHRSPSPASGAGGRRRAYAFRAPSVVAAPTPRKGGYKFDPFADEPTTPVPTLSTLASLSVPPPQQPATPRLAPASLPPPAPRQSAGLYNHQLHQRRAAAYQQRRGGAAALDAATGTTEIWRGFTPIPKARTLAYEIEEYDYDSSSSPLVNGSGGNGGLLTTPLTTPSPRPASAPPVSGSSARRSPSPPSSTSTLNPASPPFTPAASRPLSRTPSPPAPAPRPSYANTRSSMLNDKDAKARLVAGILLNRVHVPKPMRRRPMFGDVKRAYVPSGLKNVITCEA